MACGNPRTAIRSGKYWTPTKAESTSVASRCSRTAANSKFAATSAFRSLAGPRPGFARSELTAELGVVRVHGAAPALTVERPVRHAGELMELGVEVLGLRVHISLLYRNAEIQYCQY